MSKRVIYRQVTYEIEPDGNCKNCKCSILVQDWRDGELTCIAFPDSDIDGWNQCQACKDYLTNYNQEQPTCKD